MISDFCIRRPVATILMSLALIVSGLFAYRFLPVAALPQAEFPVVNVSASLPGASPDAMATSVATPLIKQFATIAGIDSISTSNAQGSTSIAIQFVLGRNIDAAAADVQAAIARAQRQLPAQMTTAPSYRKVNPADAPIMLLALVSDTTPLTQLDAFAQDVISPALSTIDGVAQVTIYGSQKYAVRIEIDPSALAARGIGIDQLETAIAGGQFQHAAGDCFDRPAAADDHRRYAAREGQRLRQRLIIGSHDGVPIRLGDVTRVVDSVENDMTASRFDGTRAIILAVQRQPDANTVDVVDRVERPACRPSRRSCRRRPRIQMLNDRSTSIRDAVERRALHAGADHRAGGDGDLRLPAPGGGDDHSGGGGADLDHRHARRDVCCSASRSTTSRCWG